MSRSRQSTLGELSEEQDGPIAGVKQSRASKTGKVVSKSKDEGSKFEKKLTALARQMSDEPEEWWKSGGKRDVGGLAAQASTASALKFYNANFDHASGTNGNPLPQKKIRKDEKQPRDGNDSDPVSAFTQRRSRQVRTPWLKPGESPGNRFFLNVQGQLASER